MDPFSIIVSAITVLRSAAAIYSSQIGLHNRRRSQRKLIDDLIHLLEQLKRDLPMTDHLIDTVNRVSIAGFCDEMREVWVESVQEIQAHCVYLVQQLVSGIKSLEDRSTYSSLIHQWLQIGDPDLQNIVRIRDDIREQILFLNNAQSNLSTIMGVNAQRRNSDQTIVPTSPQTETLCSSRRGSDSTSGSDSVTTDLISAIKTHDLAAVNASLAAGANLREQHHGWLAIHYCAHHGGKSILQAVIDAGASQDIVNAKDSVGKTALHIAAKIGRVDIGEILIQRKANIDITDSEDQTPYDAAAKHNQFDFLEMLERVEQSPNGSYSLRTSHQGRRSEEAQFSPTFDSSQQERTRMRWLFQRKTMVRALSVIMDFYSMLHAALLMRMQVRD